MKRINLPLAAVMLFGLIALAGCGGGGAGGGWSSGDLDPVEENTGIVVGYVYQGVEAANRISSARTILLPLEGATISIGGLSGTSNSSGYYTISNVPIGTYSMQLSASGFQTRAVPNVVVSDGTTTTATQQNDSTYAMTPTTTSSLVVNSTPSGASIYIDSADTSSVTSNTFTLYAGQHTIKLTLTGYENYESDEDVSSDKTVSYTMVQLVNSIAASPSNLTLVEGESYTPTVTCTFYDSSTGTCPQLAWTSSDSEVAIVGASTGEIAAASAGSASVTGTRAGSNASVSIPVTVISASDTLDQVIIDADGVSGNALSLSSGGTADFSASCIYTTAGTAACPATCSFSSSNTAAGDIDSSGNFTCETGGGLSGVKMTCGSTDSNTVEVSCAVADTSLLLKLYGAPDANSDGAADSAFATTVSVNPGDDIVMRVKAENASAITGFRTDLEIDTDYLAPKTTTDSSNCSAYSNLAYDTSKVCIENFGTVLSPSNPFFGTSSLDTVSAVTYVSGSTVDAQTCRDTSSLANRLDCAISTRQVSDVQPSADGSDYFVYFIIGSDSSVTSGAQTTVGISSDTLQVIGEDGVEIEIGSSQVSVLTINFQ